MKRNDAPQIAERSISLMTSPGLTCSPWNYPVGVLDCVRGGEHPWIPISESREQRAESREQRAESRERVPRGGVCKEKFSKRARGATTSY
ncbi:MAG: hypothetical protein CMP29_07005 [Roseibacillus sp.]|nr:hypothetical protein [Roseibacillus sp.]